MIQYATIKLESSDVEKIMGLNFLIFRGSKNILKLNNPSNRINNLSK
jgi:hypothetical protein